MHRRVRKFKKSCVCISFQVYDKQGVICLKLHIDMTEKVRKVCTHPSLSERTCTWTRLVVNTLRENMVAEIKHRKICGKLHTDTSFHEKICMWTRPCKSQSCAEGRFLRWIRITVLRVIKPMISDMISYVKSCIHTRPPMCKFAPGDVLVSQNSAEKRLLVKNCTLLRLSVDKTCRDTSH